MRDFIVHIRDELEAIQNYMEERNAFHGYGQMVDLIKEITNKLEETSPEKDKHG